MHVVDTGSEIHPASYLMGNEGAFPGGVKLSGREADHSPPTSADVKKTWIYMPTPSYAFMAGTDLSGLRSLGVATRVQTRHRSSNF
jgi:hypothetical protein